MFSVFSVFSVGTSVSCVRRVRCVRCVHYVPDTVYEGLGRCALFRNGVELEFANVARLHERKCNSTLWEDRDSKPGRVWREN